MSVVWCCFFIENNFFLQIRWNGQWKRRKKWFSIAVLGDSCAWTGRHCGICKSLTVGDSLFYLICCCFMCWVFTSLPPSIRCVYGAQLFFRVAWLSQLNQHIVNLSWNGTANKPIKSEKKFNPKDISYVPNWCDIVFLTHKAQFKLLYVDDAHENIFSPHRFSQSHFALYYLSYKVSFQLKLGKFSRLTLDRMAIVTCSYPFHSVACKFKWANDNCFY